MRSLSSTQLNDQRKDAERVISLLAQGRHPQTLEPLKGGDLIHEGSIVRALFTASEALRLLRLRAERAGKGSSKRRGAEEASRHGKGWCSEEDDELVQAFDERTCLRSIAARHGRTQGGILSRLERLGKIGDEAEGRRLLQ